MDTYMDASNGTLAMKAEQMEAEEFNRDSY